MNERIIAPDRRAGGVTGVLDVDFSLSLLNRTGAYYLSRDLIDNLRPLFDSVRCWRLPQRMMPEGLPRKLLARLMLGEYRVLGSLPLFTIPRQALKTLYLDPLYVLRTKLTKSDIVLCHDVGPLSHPELFAPETVALYRSAYEKIRRAGPGIVLVSEASKRAFIELHGTRFRFVHVIPLYPRRRAQTLQPTPVLGVHSPFILAVGGLEHRKNYLRCIEAFMSSSLSATHQFVICGPNGNAAKAVRSAAEGCSRVHVLGNVSDAQLGWLYEHAAAFFLPSLLEGFGIPVIEAAERGLICVTSAESAQEEALGGHGIFVDPTSIGSIRAGLERLTRMPDEERDACIARARAHAAVLSQDRFLTAWRTLLTHESASAQMG